MDLSPNTYSYDSVFLDFLMEQQIPAKLERLTGFPLVLGDVSLRKSFDESSYMDWHRDTYWYSGRSPVGRTPPLFKMIIYPRLTHKTTRQLKVIQGSHHRFFQNRILDRIQTMLCKASHIESSDESGIFFNSAILHGASSENIPEGSFRLMFNFCLRSQLSQFEKNRSLHETYSRLFDKKRDISRRTVGNEIPAQL